MKESSEKDDLVLVDKLKKSHLAIKQQLAKIVVGQDAVVDELLISLFCKGHVLLVGVPGLAKTLLISTIAQILDLDFKRIQFTPDLMPSDITGTEVIDQDLSTGKRNFRFIKGPLFGQIILADEINRTPPKTQAALLQAMQEYKITAAGHTYPLALPFFVLATQNPIEQEGTYPLPEAQLDRFFFQINIDYPSFDEEKEIVSRTTGEFNAVSEKLLTAQEIIALQDIVRRVPAADHAVEFAVRLARATRPHENTSPDFVKQFVNWGAGPRGAQALILGAKAKAILEGRFAVSVEDIKAVAAPALRHRVLVNFNGEAEGMTADKLISRLLEQSAG
ncbi:MAG TPA: AAA family ATPase [Elusimicrobia bacterium]|nr:MAG: AAA family ATPase [Elusimicrobia bacterium RIFOXYA12_FULL_49_49]OGS16905.1 MAG: AAA family ATPase [Elusimicrobia bacterium RIFOXYA2_FULL_47_53]OGS32133.1 MAG: AAA family ATPase [Elusimicrobia bacterium RIFOXYB2_FULL_46_23]HBU69909.1 AAA family ATPase [Elusimicrobiota bacterium]